MTAPPPHTTGMPMAAILTFLANHKALIASLIYAAALAVSGQTAVAFAIALAALSGGIKPVPPPASARF